MGQRSKDEHRHIYDNNKQVYFVLQAAVAKKAETDSLEGCEMLR